MTDTIKTQAKTLTATIDSREVLMTEGMTILRAATDAGIYIPSLCHLDCLPDYGGCRLCMVKVENMRGFPTACTTPIAQGMQISTRTDELQQLRREILELLLSEHPYTCLVCRDKKECTEFMHSTRKVGTITGCNFCPNNGTCELQHLVDYLELSEIRFPIVYRNIPPVKDNPFYELDYNLCILCGRCVRICNEERYSEVLAFINRGNAALVGTAFDETQKEAGCEFCGACIDVCPTGSLSEKMGKWVGQPDSSKDTHCSFCGIGCRMTVNTKGKRIVNVGPEPESRHNPHQLCMRGKFIPGDMLHHPDRVTRPHINRQGKWLEVSWDQALDVIAENLKKCSGDQFGLIGSAHDSIENSFVLQKFTRQTMRSANVDLSPATPYPELIRDIHDYYASSGHVTINDILTADSIHVLGAMTQWSHAIIENRIRKAYKAGKQVLVAASIPTRTVEFSTDYQRYGKGCEHIHLHRLTSELAKEKGGERILMIVGDEIINSDRARDNINNLLHLATRSNNRVRLLFLLAEGNRYGATLAGMNPVLLPGFAAARKKGLDTAKMLGRPKAISAIHLIGDLPVGPAIKKLKFFVQHNMFFTPASKFADVFLPLATTWESGGHLVNLEGSLLPLSAMVPGEDQLMTPAGAVNGIAMHMGRKVLFAGSASNPDRQLIPLVEQTLTRGRKRQTGATESPEPRSRSKNGRLTGKTLQKHHFHYLGNSLPDLVPDLAKVLEE
ncbi:MAG: molybdopterin-dependent oxidoreductase [Desulfocapsaceae bacterium]|nr:molybdopterin-dependent oxidoreductase [Desulfocapsaceae bacterium]